MRIFLDHPRRRARDPHIAILVEMAGVQARIDQLRIAPGVHHITRRIEFDDRGRQFSRIQLASKNVLPVQNEDMVLCIDANATQAAQHPLVRQRFGP